MMKIKPFLKWAGGKTRSLERIKSVLPQAKRLIEPFAGSAAVFLNTHYAENIIADINCDLIRLYTYIQADGIEFIEFVKRLFIPENNTKEAYLALRAEFNTTQDSRRKAALFVYLNKHGFNGLCRYNAKGKFNVPFGQYHKPPRFPEQEMKAFHIKSVLANFSQANFANTMKQAKSGDVIYCDPPYIPISRTANFTHYAKESFGLKEQQLLADMAVKLSRKGVTVIISNHDTEFVHTAYSGAKLIRFNVQRFISCNGAKREFAPELLAVFA